MALGGLAPATPSETLMETPATPSTSFPRIPLSDGRLVEYLRKPKAGDVSKAQRIAGPKANDVDKSAALLSLIVTIDGKAVSMDTMLDLDLDDFAAVSEAMPGGKSSPGPATES